MEAQAQDAYEPQRSRMVEEIAALARETRFETGRAALSERVMAAMAKVPRHEFVPAVAARERLRQPAAADRASARPFRSPTSSR